MPGSLNTFHVNPGKSHAFIKLIVEFKAIRIPDLLWLSSLVNSWLVVFAYAHLNVARQVRAIELNPRSTLNAKIEPYGATILHFHTR